MVVQGLTLAGRRQFHISDAHPHQVKTQMETVVLGMGAGGPNHRTIDDPDLPRRNLTGQPAPRQPLHHEVPQPIPGGAKPLEHRYVRQLAQTDGRCPGGGLPQGQIADPIGQAQAQQV
jgi:hypothetical protein